MNARASYIVPFRNASESRCRNLVRLVDWLSRSLPEVEVTIVEMDVKPNIPLHKFPRGVHHVFRPDEGIFHRSRARNLGAVHSGSDVLVFGDSDMVMSARELSSSIELCRRDYEAVNPTRALVNLTETELTELEAACVLEDPAKSPLSHTAARRILDAPFAAGIVMLRRDAFYRIGGWPEEMIGWGAEDDVLSHLIAKLLSHTTADACTFHMPHERLITDGRMHDEYERNRLKMDRVYAMSPEGLAAYCDSHRSALRQYGYRARSTTVPLGGPADRPSW